MFAEYLEENKIYKNFVLRIEVTIEIFQTIRNFFCFQPYVISEK